MRWLLPGGGAPASPSHVKGGGRAEPTQSERAERSTTRSPQPEGVHRNRKFVGNGFAERHSASSIQTGAGVTQMNVGRLEMQIFIGVPATSRLAVRDEHRRKVLFLSVILLAYVVCNLQFICISYYLLMISDLDVTCDVISCTEVNEIGSRDRSLRAIKRCLKFQNQCSSL